LSTQILQFARYKFHERSKLIRDACFL
jgi:hypothetical protein